MSVPEALRFLSEVKQDPALRDRLRGLGAPADLEPVRRVGAAAGFAFTADELRTAFKHDWAMRWLRHRIREGDGSGERHGAGIGERP